MPDFIAKKGGRPVYTALKAVLRALKLQMKKFFKRLALTLTALFSAVVFAAGCSPEKIIDKLIRYELPDFSLIADYPVTYETNTAIYAKNMPRCFVTRDGIKDVEELLKAKLSEEGGEPHFTGLETSYQKSGIYCIFTGCGHNFNMGLLSYDGNEFSYVLQTDAIESGYVYNGSTDEYAACSWTSEGDILNVAVIPFSDPENFAVFKAPDAKETLEAVYQGGDGEFIIETSRDGGDDATIKTMHLFSVGEKLILKSINFDAGGGIYVGAGENLAMVCAQDSGSWFMRREDGEYRTENFGEEVNAAILAAKHRQIVGDYFVIGNPCLEESKVFSFADRDYIEGPAAARAKEVAAGRKGDMFTANYNKYSKTFVFESEKIGEDEKLRSEVKVFGDGTDADVPEILQTVSVASEVRENQGIVSVDAFSDSGRNIFTCIYLDKYGNRIYCVFEFIFKTGEEEKDRIEYLGACGEGAGLLNLPGRTGIGIVLYD